MSYLKPQTTFSPTVCISQPTDLSARGSLCKSRFISECKSGSCSNIPKLYELELNSADAPPFFLLVPFKQKGRSSQEWISFISSTLLFPACHYPVGSPSSTQSSLSCAGAADWGVFGEFPGSVCVWVSWAVLHTEMDSLQVHIWEAKKVKGAVVRAEDAGETRAGSESGL